MNVLKNTFLFRLFRADKLLFGVIAFYMLGVAYYALRQREEFPFFLYGMYSLKEKPQPTYSTYSIVIDDVEIRYARLRDAQRELMTASIDDALPLLAEGKLSAGYTPQQGEAAIDAVIAKFLAEGPDEYEFTKVQNRSESSLEFSEVELFNRCLNLAWFTLMGNTELVNQEAEMIRAVTPAQIRKVAAEVLQETNSSVLYYHKNSSELQEATA